MALQQSKWGIGADRPVISPLMTPQPSSRARASPHHLTLAHFLQVAASHKMLAFPREPPPKTTDQPQGLRSTSKTPTQEAMSPDLLSPKRQSFALERDEVNQRGVIPLNLMNILGDPYKRCGLTPPPGARGEPPPDTTSNSNGSRLSTATHQTSSLKFDLSVGSLSHSAGESLSPPSHRASSGAVLPPPAALQAPHPPLRTLDTQRIAAPVRGASPRQASGVHLKPMSHEGAPGTPQTWGGSLEGGGTAGSFRPSMLGSTRSLAASPRSPLPELKEVRRIALPSVASSGRDTLHVHVQLSM